MSVMYEQATGALHFPHGLDASAYSGHGTGFNNPLEEAVASEGPIPAGEWEIVSWTQGEEHYIDHHGRDKGPVVAVLRPIGHDAHGRSGFLIHGDNAAMNHTASDGCIVAARDTRLNWRACRDKSVLVVPSRSKIQ